MILKRNETKTSTSQYNRSSLRYDADFLYCTLKNLGKQRFRPPALLSVDFFLRFTHVECLLTFATRVID